MTVVRVRSTNFCTQSHTTTKSSWITYLLCGVRRSQRWNISIILCAPRLGLTVWATLTCWVAWKCEGRAEVWPVLKAGCFLPVSNGCVNHRRRHDWKYLNGIAARWPTCCGFSVSGDVCMDVNGSFFMDCRPWMCIRVLSPTLSGSPEPLDSPTWLIVDALFRMFLCTLNIVTNFSDFILQRGWQFTSMNASSSCELVMAESSHKWLAYFEGLQSQTGTCLKQRNSLQTRCVCCLNFVHFNTRTMIDATRSCHGTRSLWHIAVTATRFWMCEGKVIGATRSCLGYVPAARFLSPPLNLNSSVLFEPPVVWPVESVFVKDASGEYRASPRSAVGSWASLSLAARCRRLLLDASNSSFDQIPDEWRKKSTQHSNMHRHRNMFESWTSAEATEKLPFFEKFGANISS